MQNFEADKKDATVERRSSQKRKDPKSLPAIFNQALDDKNEETAQKGSKRKLSRTTIEGNESKEPDLSNDLLHRGQQQKDAEISVKTENRKDKRQKKSKVMDDIIQSNKGKKKNKDPRQKSSNEIFFADL